VLEQQKEQNNVSATPSPLKEEESVTTAGTVIAYESTITSVSNDEEKLTTTEDKEDDFGQKSKKAQNAFQDLFTTAIDTGKSIASEKAKKLAAMNFYTTADII
jgi:hypothetical protein